MQTNQIKLIENCFNPHHVIDMSNAVIASPEEHQAFLQLIEDYKCQAHVIEWSNSHQQHWEDTHDGCPF